MAITFRKATKKQARLRMALCGPSGSGKTYSSLSVGTNLAQGGNVLVLDTERGSASKYADKFEFDCFDEWDGNYSPERLIEMIGEAGKQGYAVIIIDSLSHFWMGTGGELDMVDRVAKRSQSGNSFAAWKEVTPIHNRLVEALLSAPMHVICTMRTKTEWVIEENDRGKKVPRKIGMAPIMRDGIEFEFDVCGDMNQSNELVITKTRCSSLAEQVIRHPGEQVAKTLIAWLSDGQEASELEKILAGMKDGVTCKAIIAALVEKFDDPDEASPILDRHGKIDSTGKAKNLAADLYAALQAERESRAA